MNIPQFDNAKAIPEGWMIATRSDLAVPYAIEKLDDPSDHEGNTGRTFPADKDAYIHVALAAAAGSAYHRSALAFLEEHSPEGYRWVQSWIPRRAA